MKIGEALPLFLESRLGLMATLGKRFLAPKRFGLGRGFLGGNNELTASKRFLLNPGPGRFRCHWLNRSAFL